MQYNLLKAFGLVLFFWKFSPLVAASSSTIRGGEVSPLSQFTSVQKPDALMSTLEVCDLLQELSEEGSSDNDESTESLATLDKLKAQKLLYYAQGYFLAILEKKIFSDPIEAWDYGPAIRTLHDNWKDLKGTTLPKGVFKKARRRSQDLTLTIQEISSFLRTILDMFTNFSGKDLIDKTHDETPWKEAYARFKMTDNGSKKSDEPIPHNDLITFFRKPPQLFSFLSSYIRVNGSEPRKIQYIIDRVRFILSHTYLTNQEIDELHRAFLNKENREAIDAIYTSCDANLAWAGIDRLDCVVGYIFLPLQCEQLYEHFPVYFHFERIKRLLTLSARHHHPLAHAYLDRILSSYKNDAENADEKCDHLDEKAQQALATYLEPSLPRETICPALYVGLLRLKFGQAAHALDYFTKGYEQGSALCGYYHVLRNKLTPMLTERNFIELLNTYHEGLLPFLEAELATDQKVRYEKYLLAGEKGLAEGSFLGAMVQHDQQPSQLAVPNKTQLYLTAGRQGALGGYEKALETLLKANKMQEAVEVCHELNRLGSTYGYALLGKSLQGEDAHRVLRLASILESYPSLRRFEIDEMEYEGTYRNELNREYHKLRIDANYETLSPDEL